MEVTVQLHARFNQEEMSQGSNCFSCQTQQYTKQLAHISLCMTEFIGRTVLQHVSAYGAIIRRYINKAYTTELCLLG
jgi:hypothetical protein